ncbi:toprim domain-containing protein [Rhodocytophaga aerolata]|uniref:Toprim domain-containing protein n=1 Tax=Rhodocytophaga aerolata TaxID=455078 RepID=A0ABT8QYA5_9BACT|nr:toprim domain-containing protein [Rhodocytophaga aerolata]MDO1444649.1 toprim domain-containing protein [Rhodocytophaga aerolata]
MYTIDWKEAAHNMDPYKVLNELGFRHNPKKGLVGSARSQTFEREEEKITVYPNPGSKAIFINHGTDKKGDVIELLKWQYNNDPREVSKFIHNHFNGMPPAPLSVDAKKNDEKKDTKTDDKTLAEIQSKELKEKYSLRNSLNQPQYLQSRGLTLGTIFRPEFFKQALNSLGWNAKEEKTIEVNNTVFPMRNDHGITSMIIRNGSFKGFPAGERRDALWLSNPPLTLNRDIIIGLGEKKIMLPKGTEGTLVASPEKPGRYQFYFLDPTRKDKELPYNKVEVWGKALTWLTTALEPLKVNRMVLTESPIDAMSFHQLSPPKPGETRMYLSTGGNPSDKQTAYINELVQRIRPDQVVLANDNEKNGVRFNMNLMGAIQHPATPAQNLFMARLVEVAPKKEDNTITSSTEQKSHLGEYHLKIFGAKEPKRMEEVATKIMESINNSAPKGQEPPARITALNSSPGTGSEITVAFPKNDHLLAAAQKELAKIINAGERDEVMKVVKPVNKDFNEDLQAEKLEGKKIKHDLGEIPAYIKTGAKNLLQQLSAYSNNAFDALFGGIPGSLPRMMNTPEEKKASSDRGHRKESDQQVLPEKDNNSRNLSADPHMGGINKSNHASTQPQPYKTNHKEEHLSAGKELSSQKQAPAKPGLRMKMR